MLDFAREKKLQKKELLSVLLAVENHLRWGGVSTLQAFMRDLPAKGYPKAIETHFQQFTAGWNKRMPLQYRCKEKAKEILRRYPPMYRAMAAVYRLMKSQ